MDWAQCEGVLHVYLHHQSKSHHGVYGAVDSGIAQREVIVVNAVVDTAPWWVGKAHSEAPFLSPFLGNSAAGVDSKAG